MKNVHKMERLDSNGLIRVNKIITPFTQKFRDFYCASKNMMIVLTDQEEVEYCNLLILSKRVGRERIVVRTLSLFVIWLRIQRIRFESGSAQKK